ncbi:MAG TPA: HAD family phosphatase [Prolixibacteraceae bacterium]|nr:HAD family phosphatase [Prolixibacteraceae bacterium]
MTGEHSIKNLILDLGGVLIDIDPHLSYAAFKRILLPRVIEQTDWKEINEAVVMMETGKWSNDRFKEFMLSNCKPGTTPSQMIDAWCAMLLEFPARRLHMLRQLASHYRLYLLSNTNEYHIRFFEFEFANRFHIPLNSMFTKIYYSSRIGFRKPDPECYRYVLDDARIVPSETVMIDDRTDNCQAAESLGMQSMKVPEQSGLEALMETLIQIADKR